MAKILVVDDDANNRLLLTSILKYELHTVLEAENGAVGLALAAQRVREDPALEHMKLALSTGTTVTAAIEDFLEVYRVEAIIPKPAEPQEILERIRVALR